MTTIHPHGLFQQAFSFTHIIQVEHIDPFTLPSVGLEQRDRLPRVAAIYFAISEAKILYIGKSVNLSQRWQRHQRANQLQSYSNAAIAWLHITNPEQDLEELEEKCINHFKPSLNGTVIRGANDHREGNATAMALLRSQFGRRLALLRRQSGYTQEDLAFEAYLSRDQISLMENGKSGASFDSLGALAEVLNVEVMDFFDFRDLA